MAIFDGRILTYQNESNSFPNDSFELLDEYMLQVRAYGQLNIKAIQIELKAALLNTNDVFIICSNDKTYYVWCGKGNLLTVLIMSRDLMNNFFFMN